MTSALVWGIGAVVAVTVARAVVGAAPPKRLPAEPTPPGVQVPAFDRPLTATSPVAPEPSAGSMGRVPPARRGQVRRVRPGHAVLVGLALALVSPALAPVPLALVVLASRLDRRRQQRRRDAAVVDQLPDLVDLLRLTTLAGLPVGAALGAIGDRPGGVVGPAVAHSAQLLARGATTAHALATFGEVCGAAARSLVDALADHDRYGTPLGPNLDRVAVECRLRRRRRAEEAARRLPVTLLFPLVLTTLPAFVILTIVPLLVGSFRTLQI